MPTEVTLNLPDNVYHQAIRLAQLMNEDLAQVLTETIEVSLNPLGSSDLDLTPVETLSDQDVLVAGQLQMNARQGNRLNELLDRQQAGSINDTERSELAALMQVYHELLVRKAQALHEAVRRGLLQPLQS